VSEVIHKLESTKSIFGPVNFQFKLSSSKLPIVFDFNTRLASGGLALSVYSGFDIPKLLVDVIMDKPVEPFVPFRQFDKTMMIKYYDEFFE
jgi:biotin carboxylase